MTKEKKKELLEELEAIDTNILYEMSKPEALISRLADIIRQILEEGAL